jgi:hypothetical protein
MKKIKETLWADYENVSDKLKVTDIDNAKYESLLEERDKIRNELIKLEQSTMDVELKRTQIEVENKRDTVRNLITIGTFVVSTSLSLYAISKTFRFDQESTVTSTLGRGILNSVIPKMSKR